MTNLEIIMETALVCAAYLDDISGFIDDANETLDYIEGLEEESYEDNKEEIACVTACLEADLNYHHEILHSVHDETVHLGRAANYNDFPDVTTEYKNMVVDSVNDLGLGVLDVGEEFIDVRDSINHYVEILDHENTELPVYDTTDEDYISDDVD